MRVRFSGDVESRGLWRALYHSIALIMLRQQRVDTSCMLSPALLEHKDFRAPGQEMSQKKKEKRGRKKEKKWRKERKKKSYRK